MITDRFYLSSFTFSELYCAAKLKFALIVKVTKYQFSVLNYQLLLLAHRITGVLPGFGAADQSISVFDSLFF